jgi:hypothetical protein
MKRILLNLVIIAAFLAFPQFAMAQASRTWVSGVGDDANPCSRTAPCKTFAGAISKTAAGGEIDALDPSGYGAVTITKAITIDGGAGQVASVLVSGTNGIVVSAGASDVVILRNLTFNGLGAGLSGINYLAGGHLIVDHCAIDRFTTNGIRATLTASGELTVSDTNINTAATAAVSITTTSGTLFASFTKINIRNSGNGIVIKAGVVADVSDSMIGGTTGTGLFVQGGVLSASRNIISNSALSAVLAQGGVTRLTANNIYNNGADVSIAGGTVGTTGNNVLAGNGGSAASATFTSY